MCGSTSIWTLQTWLVQSAFKAKTIHLIIRFSWSNHYILSWRVNKCSELLTLLWGNQTPARPSNLGQNRDHSESSLYVSHVEWFGTTVREKLLSLFHIDKLHLTNFLNTAKRMRVGENQKEGTTNVTKKRGGAKEKGGQIPFQLHEWYSRDGGQTGKEL